MMTVPNRRVVSVSECAAIHTVSSVRRSIRNGQRDFLLVLIEADGGCEVVEEPEEVAIVELDHSEARAIDEKVGLPQSA